MKKLATVVIAVLLIAHGYIGKSQDKHFSQFDAAPLYYNPALVGVYDGSHWFIGNIKHQWGVYRTYMLSYDRMLPAKFKLGGGFFGIGGMINSDKEGTIDYGSYEFNLMPAYHRPIIDNKVMLSAGVNIENKLYTYDQSAIKSAGNIDPETGELVGTDGRFESENEFNIDISMGVNLHYVIKEKYATNLGITWFHLASTEKSFISSRSAENPRRFAVNANTEIPLTNELKLLPSLIWVYQNPAYQLLTGTYARYDVSKLNKIVQGIYLGSWYRLGDAVIFGLAMDFPGFDVNHTFNFGISYDVTVSEYNDGLEWDKSSSVDNGSFEISLKYIIKNAPFKFQTPGIINEPVM